MIILIQNLALHSYIQSWSIIVTIRLIIAPQSVIPSILFRVIRFTTNTYLGSDNILCNQSSIIFRYRQYSSLYIGIFSLSLHSPLTKVIFPVVFNGLSSPLLLATAPRFYVPLPIYRAVHHHYSTLLRSVFLSHVVQVDPFRINITGSFQYLEWIHWSRDCFRI